MEDELVERRPDDLEVIRRLDAFAQLRLAPEASAMARIRTALVAQAGGIADALAAAPAIPDHAPAATVQPRAILVVPRLRPSRVGAALLAAGLTVGLLAGGVAASSAGGPLYESRLWIEEATLPAEPLARADAQLARLDARLAELRSATASRDAGAATAALDAYSAILVDLEAHALANATVGSTLVDDIARRQLVLVGLLDEVPVQAQAAIQHALQEGANAVDLMDGDRPGRPAQPGVPSQGGHGQDGQGGSGSQGGSVETEEPDPTPTPAVQEPERTPKPTKPPKAPAPEPTPVPQPTAPGAGDEQDGQGGGMSGQTGGSERSGRRGK